MPEASSASSSSTYPATTYWLRTSTRAEWSARRTASVARNPSSVWVGGMRTSTMPRSGRCSAIAATKASPSPTPATTWWPASARMSCNPSRRRTESSATTTRSDGDVLTAGAPPR